MSKYESKTVVITGGSSGFGLATAQLLVTGEARVMITARTQASLDSAMKQLGSNVIVMRSDVASMPDIDALADWVKAEPGTLGFLFVNPGATRFIPFESVPEERYDEILAVNAKGLYFTVQRLAPLIRQGGTAEGAEVAAELATLGRRNGDQA